MAQSTIDLNMNIEPRIPGRLDHGIGCIGAGFIMRDVHLVAYKAAGFRPVALAVTDACPREGSGSSPRRPESA